MLSASRCSPLRGKSPTIFRAGKMIKLYTSETTEICGSDGIGSVPLAIEETQKPASCPILLMKSNGRGKGKWI